MLRRGHLLERIVDRIGRISLFDCNSLYLHPRMVGIENLLHLLGDLGFNLRPPVAHGIVQSHLTDDRPHCAFRNFADGLVRVRHLEQIEFRGADIPTDLVSEIEEILVAGEHQIVGVRRAEIDRPDFLNVDLRHPFNWRR